MDKTFLTEPEVAELLRCSTSKVKRLRLSGELPFVKGRPVLIRAADVDALVRARTVRPSEPELARDPLDQKAAREWAMKAATKPRRYRAKSE